MQIFLFLLILALLRFGIPLLGTALIGWVTNRLPDPGPAQS